MDEKPCGKCGHEINDLNRVHENGIVVEEICAPCTLQKQNAELARLREQMDYYARNIQAHRSMGETCSMACLYCEYVGGKLKKQCPTHAELAREVERVQVLEKVAQRFAALNAEYHHFEDGQSIPPEPWVEMEWTLGAKALIALDKKGGK